MGRATRARLTWRPGAGQVERALRDCDLGVMVDGYGWNSRWMLESRFAGRRCESEPRSTLIVVPPTTSARLGP